MKLPRPSPADPPLVLIEAGTEPEGLPVPVVTKDERVTTVHLDWSSSMPIELIDDAIRVLSPVRGDHPRFAIVLDRLELRRRWALQGGDAEDTSTR